MFLNTGNASSFYPHLMAPMRFNISYWSVLQSQIPDQSSQSTKEQNSAIFPNLLVLEPTFEIAKFVPDSLSTPQNCFCVNTCMSNANTYTCDYHRRRNKCKDAHRKTVEIGLVGSCLTSVWYYRIGKHEYVRPKIVLS